MFWVLVYEAVNGHLVLVESLKVVTAPECQAAAQFITQLGRAFAFCVIPGQEI